MKKKRLENKRVLVSNYIKNIEESFKETSLINDADVIKIYEDYDKTERIAWKLQEAKNEETFQKEYRIYELSQVADMPSMPSYQIPFRHLCNLLQVQAGNIEAVLDSLPDLKEEQRARLEQRAKCAWNWIRESGHLKNLSFLLMSLSQCLVWKKILFQLLKK